MQQHRVAAQRRGADVRSSTARPGTATTAAAAFTSGCRRQQQQRSFSAAGQHQQASTTSSPVCTAAAAGSEASTGAISRRQLALGSGLLLLGGSVAAAAPPARAAEGGQGLYADPQDGFKLTLPAGWQSSEGLLEGNSSFTGASGARRTLAWWPADVPADNVNVTLTVTNTSVEFTKLGSFGNVYTFSQNLVNSMDRSFLLRNVRSPLASGAGTPAEPIQVAKLLDASDNRGMYELEYTVAKMPGVQRHLYSVVALASNGRYNRLYTLTGQCLEEQVGEYKAVLKQVLASFEPPAPASAGARA